MTLPSARPAPWATLVTESEWRALGPAFAADPPLEDELVHLLAELGPSARKRLVAHLAARLDGSRPPVGAVGPALETLMREGLQAVLGCPPPEPAGGAA